MSALTSTVLDDLTLVSQGKVRDVYATSDPESLLFVATDRISAYDVILKNGIPGKGRILTSLSLFWFEYLKDVIPNHLITANIDEMPSELSKHKDILQGRSMLVRKAKVIPIEAIVRGYITGSAWSEYQKSGTVHGMQVPPGLRESDKLPEPIFTPSTKAEQGQHDENISPEQAATLIGAELASEIARVSLELYTRAAAHALSRGVILADTKFEFGLITPSSDSGSSSSPTLILIDEVLTPDSSRYWPAKDYEPGKNQPSFDKQFLRDWLVAQGFKKGLEDGPEGSAPGTGWEIAPEVVEGTASRYQEAMDLLTA
ncbi:phosphoribosylaminoimidazole-succinocarboxamide synthase [Clavulina sp. PMI_390]|nr:phosphoribosylaminoimidazole-succinocarboxamide synthase [Clavulina sp. PMI_390]